MCTVSWKTGRPGTTPAVIHPGGLADGGCIGGWACGLLATAPRPERADLQERQDRAALLPAVDAAGDPEVQQDGMVIAQDGFQAQRRHRGTAHGCWCR